VRERDRVSEGERERERGRDRKGARRLYESLPDGFLTRMSLTASECSLNEDTDDDDDDDDDDREQLGRY
jgi:hypothetical protein